jgi:hypothetical protein
MSRGRRLIFVNFHEHESCGVVGLLHDIEAKDTWLLKAVAGIVFRGLDERRDTVLFDMDIDVNDIHRASPLCSYQAN